MPVIAHPHYHVVRGLCRGTVKLGAQVPTGREVDTFLAVSQTKVAAGAEVMQMKQLLTQH
ncbi:hypothetical protein [Mesorhizobium sp. L-8-10]|uniref:hypothetical protein n=2 Tax=unclassified Mesorhizobium TaxID=325217 RepID=UPI001AEF8D91|nr:hypothetical protein [Mesorhizobium sp. L-8-10]